MNMNKFFDGIVAEKKQTGVNIVNPDNNKVINEAVILDELGGNQSALLEFYNNIGAFGARDGILNETAALDIKIKSFDKKNVAKMASVLSVAQESGCEDYDMYVKATLLMEAAMDNMMAKYSQSADSRLNDQRREVLSNPRVIDALAKTRR